MLTGIIPIIKPSGKNSTHITSAVKKKLNIKAGHFGTLDPMATGVLPIMVGSSTRLSNYLYSRKEYIAVLKLGIKTDTGDITGKVVESSEKIKLNMENIQSILKSFIGNIIQTPPIYSALSVNGKRLYEYAREGKEVTINSRETIIYSCELLSFDENEQIIEFKTNCESGTYIRSLCVDIAAKLLTVGTMQSLVRTASAGFLIEDSVFLDDFLNSDNPEKFIVLPSEIFKNKEFLILPISGEKYYLNGGTLNADRFENLNKTGIYKIIDTSGDFCSLGECFKENDELFLKSVWLFNTK